MQAGGNTEKCCGTVWRDRHVIGFGQIQLANLVTQDKHCLYCETVWIVGWQETLDPSTHTHTHTTPASHILPLIHRLSRSTSQI